MLGDGVMGSAKSTTNEHAVTTFAMSSADSGMSLNLPVCVVRVGTSEPAASANDVDANVGGVTIEASSAVCAFDASARSKVWNGAVKGDSARKSSAVAHSFVQVPLRPSRAFDMRLAYTSHPKRQASLRVSSILSLSLAGRLAFWHCVTTEHQ